MKLSEWARETLLERLEPVEVPGNDTLLGLQPHRTDTLTIADPLPIEKVRDIVGLYMNPPDHALVFCVDEKRQIQRPAIRPLWCLTVETCPRGHTPVQWVLASARISTQWSGVVHQIRPRQSDANVNFYRS